MPGTWAFREAFKNGRRHELHFIGRRQMRQDALASAAAFQAAPEPQGAGPYAPVATTPAMEGAHNRRVELFNES